MALGDSISESQAYISSMALDCMLPDFSFAAGYRLVGQPGLWTTEVTASSGETAQWGLERLRTTNWYEELRPEVATVMFGTNERWSGWQGLEQFAHNLRGIVDELLEHHVIPLLMTLPPGDFPTTTAREICGQWYDPTPQVYGVAHFAQVIRDIAAERRLPLVDVFRQFEEYDRTSFLTLLADEEGLYVHPCHGSDCPGGEDSLSGAEVRNDAVLRMYKYLEFKAMTRCPHSQAPEPPSDYTWNATDILSNFMGLPPHSYCPDPVMSP
jgi:lysophospholipase L1-like esterase